MERQWLLDRCREVEAEPDGRLDLWAREHYKSTIITFGKTLQDVLATHGDDPLGPERTFGIFSHSRPIAKGFLRQIKREVETNQVLKALFPDVLWSEPAREAPMWSEDGGLIFRRKSNPKEATIEAWGLVDGQPTSKHYSDLVYDDVVTRESVTTPEMIEKTTEALAHSYNLGAAGGRRRFIGTRYHFSDSYRTIEDRGTAKVRKYPATVDGTVNGVPVFMSDEMIAQKRRDMGPHVFGTQMLLDPKSEQVEGFNLDWLDYWTTEPSGGNRYMVVDPANEKKKKSDYTAAWMVELRSDLNYYVIDMVRDRLSLTERADLLFRWHKKYRPIAVGYEKYGKDADIEHIEDRQERENYRFTITPLGGPLAKPERIKRLIPVFEQGRVLLPPTLPYTNYEGRTLDLVEVFKREEYEPFPVGSHDDMFDALARILDDELHAEFPMEGKVANLDDFPSEF
jgi:phage terminase large subunit-like protein